MKQNDNPLKEYSRFLDSTFEHLSYEVLSIFINLSEDFSEKETEFIENHLRQCEDCTQKFNEVFDDEFEFDDERISIPIRTKLVSSEGRKILTGRGFEIEIQRPEDKKLFLQFKEMPTVCHGKKMRITLPQSGRVVRLNRVEPNKPVEISGAENIEANNIDEIKVEVLAQTHFTEQRSALPRTKTTVYFRYAVAAVIILGMMSTLLFLNRERTGPEGDPLFAENAILENLMEQTLASQDQFAILEPAIGDSVEIPFRFKWQEPEEGEYFGLVLVNNQNEEIWHKNTPDSELQFAGRLTPGLYYWKIQVGKRLVGLGKFLVPRPKPGPGRASVTPTKNVKRFSPPSGLISWWPGDGNANDIIVGRNGTLVNGATFVRSGSGQAFSFDGVDDYVSVPDNDLWSLPGDFTVNFWVNFSSSVVSIPYHPGAVLIGNDDGPAQVNTWFFGLGSRRGNSELCIHINGPTPEYPIGGHWLVNAPFNPVVGRWYHLTLTRSGNTYTIYLNGNAVGSETSSVVIPNPAAPLTIGKAEELYSHTLIKDVMIFKRALTPDEIQAIFNAGRE